MVDLIVFLKDVEKTSETVKKLMKEKLFLQGDLKVTILDYVGAGKEFLSEIEGGTALSFYDASELNEGEALRLGLEKTSGNAISFMTDECDYEDGALEMAFEALEKAKVVSLLPVNASGSAYMPFPGSCLTGFYKIDLSLTPSKFHTVFPAYFFNRALLKKELIRTDLPWQAGLAAALEVLDQAGTYTLIKKKVFCSAEDETNYFAYEYQFYPDWYTVMMDKYLKSAVQPGASLFRQHYVLYLLRMRYACNLNERDKAILSPDEVQEFIKGTSEALKNIDDVVIATMHLNNRQNIPGFSTLNFLRLKYDDVELMPEIISTGATLTAHVNGARLWTLSDYKLEIKVMYFDGENVIMDGSFPGSYVFRDEDMYIEAVVDETRSLVPERTRVYSLAKFFNLSARNCYTFRLSIPEKELENIHRLQFMVNYQGRRYPLVLSFVRPEAKLSSVGSSYWVCGNHSIRAEGKKRFLLVEPLTKKNHLVRELKLYKSMLKDSNKKRTLKVVAMRTLYWCSRPFLKNKKVWLTQDKLFKAGDNGEYFYRYVMKEAPADVKMYYVVNKTSPDYARLKKEYKTIVKFNSLKHRLLALNCDLMLATHVDTMRCNGFSKDGGKYFTDLYNARVCCLAHGLTIQQIAQYQNRTFDNTVLYFFASPYEVENVSKPVYDYYDKSMLKLTGHARYDGLINNDQKIILITPTWRRGATTGKANKGSTYDHSSTFKHTTYYKIYNDLITDQRLIDTAKESGYRIVYLLHPAMSSQLEDFTPGEGVEVVAAASDISYEKILTESSLMVTDYSGVQFDFAYMKKPLVYYHPSALPPQYESSGLVYETMGFGPICKEHEQIVDQLCSYMKKNCQMEDMYKERVDAFFKYSDHDNCSRIYKDVREFQERFEKVNTYHYGGKKA